MTSLLLSLLVLTLFQEPKSQKKLLISYDHHVVVPKRILAEVLFCFTLLIWGFRLITRFLKSDCVLVKSFAAILAFPSQNDFTILPQKMTLMPD